MEEVDTLCILGFCGLGREATSNALGKSSQSSNYVLYFILSSDLLEVLPKGMEQHVMPEEIGLKKHRIAEFGKLEGSR